MTCMTNPPWTVVLSLSCSLKQTEKLLAYDWFPCVFWWGVCRFLTEFTQMKADILYVTLQLNGWYVSYANIRVCIETHQTWRYECLQGYFCLSAGVQTTLKLKQLEWAASTRPWPRQSWYSSGEYFCGLRATHIQNTTLSLQQTS